jgi:hypothetical protein
MLLIYLPVYTFETLENDTWGRRNGDWRTPVSTSDRGTIPMRGMVMDREIEADPKSPVREPATEQTAETGKGEDRIRCPFCGWTPSARDTWMCSCLHLWNTFDTGGVCPECLKQWMETQCPKCHHWTPHSAWYPPH